MTSQCLSVITCAAGPRAVRLGVRAKPCTVTRILTTGPTRMTFDDALLTILRCPSTGSTLTRQGSALRSEDAEHTYPLIEGIPWLLQHPRNSLLDWGAKLHHFQQVLLGELERDSGNVKLNPALRITYLDQTRHTLRPKDTLWEALAPQGGDSIMVQGKQRHVAAYAKDFLFKPEQLRQAVSALSGGERNRLTLAIALAQSTDVLVLDEPTNDLDMQTLDLLEDMLMNFEGTLILVSHDRAFLDATVTSCLVPLGEGRWVETAGGWTDAQSQIKGKPGKASKAEKKSKSAKPKPSEPKKATKLSFKDQHRLKEVEAAMPRLESEISELESKLADPNLFNDHPDEFQRINTRLESARADLEQAELDWMEIEEKKEALAAS